MGLGVAAGVAGVVAVGAAAWAWESRRRHRAQVRRAIAERLASIYDPVWECRQRTERMWHEALAMPAEERRGWLQSEWKPAIEETHALLDAHAEVRDDASELARYLRDLNAHLEARDDEPPYPWDVLDELATLREALRQSIAR